MSNSTLFVFLNEHPIFPGLILIANVLGFFPILCLLYIAQIAPLHNNCRYILCLWASSFGVLFTIQCGLALLDLQSDAGYMPTNIFFPPMRFKYYQWHVMCTTFCATFEIALSVERIISITKPRHYHFSGFAWKRLILLTAAMILNAYIIDSGVHHKNIFPQLVGCGILAVLEISVLAVGAYASRACRERYKIMYGKSTLNERYQVKEAYEMSKAMIPVYITSYILKQTSITALTVYFAILSDETKYITGFLQCFMLMAHASNGVLSVSNLLLKHPQLRKQTNRKFRSIMGLKSLDTKRRNSVVADTETYFSMYTNSWK